MKSVTLFRLLSPLLVLSLLISSFAPRPGKPNQVTSPFQPQDVAAASEFPAGPAGQGLIRFSPTVDQDPHPSSNPAATVGVPVGRFGTPQNPNVALFSTVTLAVEIQPTNPNQNPAGTPVTFRVWQENSDFRLEKTARSDAWGAAAIEAGFDPAHLSGRFFYQATAPGFGQTAVRSFTFDQTQFASDLQTGVLHLSHQVEESGRITFDITSDRPLSDNPLAVELLLTRLIPVTIEPGRPQTKLMPPIIARRLDAHHAQAQLYLADGGDYLVTASAKLVGESNGFSHWQPTGQSQPYFLKLGPISPPPVAIVEALADPQQTNWQVQYRTPDGDLAFARLPLANLPPPTEEEALPTLFQETNRVGPFEWQTHTYTTSVQVLTDDGNKVVLLKDFHYDPIARTYDLEVQSRLDQAIDDKMTIEILGPNGVVIYQETLPIYLDPARPFRHQVEVPSDRGEPYGLRVTVHDPFSIEWLIQQVGDGIEGIYNTLYSAAEDPDGLTLAAAFEFGFTILGTDIAILAITCTVGNGCRPEDPEGLLFEDSGNWFNTISEGVINHLQETFPNVADLEDPKAIIKIIGEGLNLGGLEFTATASVRYTKTLVDPGQCATPAEAEEAKEFISNRGDELGDLTEALTGKLEEIIGEVGREGITIPVPSISFLSFKISPVLGFSLSGGKAGDYQLFVAFNGKIGTSAEVILKLPNYFGSLASAGKYTIALYLLVREYQRASELIGFIESLGEISGGAGCGSGGGGNSSGTGGSGGGRGNNPGAPSGRPDDRQDAFQTDFLNLPAGASGDVFYLRDQFETAQAANLDRAARYWELLLRRAERAAFELDTQRAISYTNELETIGDNALQELTDLENGTILPPPGQTVTEAMELVYQSYFVDITNTQYSQERQAIEDALAFAELRYNQLRGQELELQRELRLMLAEQNVGVVDSGIAFETVSAIGSFGVRASLVQVLPGDTTVGYGLSRYYAPLQAPRVLIVPSGGLYRFVGSQQAQDWFESYVALGGTLIVLAQADSSDWEFLPGGELRGLGYFQDILCRTASVKIVNPSPWLVGMSRDMPDLQLDGSFSQWPAGANIILMRTTGNQMPAMLEYSYGTGRVIAMSLYPDWHMNALQSKEDTAFARSLFSLAYLQATGRSLATSTNPNQATSLTFTVTNTMPVSATEITLLSDYYDTNIFGSHRWSFWAGNQAQSSQIIPLVPPLERGQSRQITFDFTAPAMSGIFRTGYFLAGVNYWAQSGGLGGPFYQVNSPVIVTDLFNFHLTTDAYDYQFGETATLIATLRNDRPVARDLTLQALAGMPAVFPETITLDPGQTVSRTFSTVVQANRDVRFAVYEDDTLVSNLFSQIRIQPPTLGLSGDVSEVAADVAANATFTVTVTSAADGTPVEWEIRQNGFLVMTDTTTLASQGDYLTSSLPVSLPAASLGSKFTVKAAIPGREQTLTIPVVSPAHLVTAILSGVPVIGQTNPNAVRAFFETANQPSTVAVQILLQQYGYLTLSTSPVVSITLPAQSNDSVTFDLDLPAVMEGFSSYSVVISATAYLEPNGFSRLANSESNGFSHLAGVMDTFYLPLNANGPTTSLDNSQYQANQPLTILVRPAFNSVRIPDNGPFNLTFYDPDNNSYPVVVTQTTPLGNSQLIQTFIPDLPVGGDYTLIIESPALLYWQAYHNLSIPDANYETEVPAGANLGDLLPWTASNTGGVNGGLIGQLQLLDSFGNVVASQPVSLNLPINGSATLTLSVPSQLSSGNYLVRFSGQDLVGQNRQLNDPVAINGLSVSLVSESDRPVYLTSDTVSTTSTIATNAPLSGAQLLLEVLKVSGGDSGWDSWYAPAGNGGFDNHINQLAVPPFTPTWHQDSYDPDVVSADDLVIYASDLFTSTLLTALNGADGTTAWSVELPSFLSALQVNGQSVIYYGTTSFGNPSQLTALDLDSGAIQWDIAWDGYDNELLVSDAAVAIFDFNTFDFALHDALTGSLIGNLPADEARLVGNQFIAQVGDQLTAYDATTLAQQWAVTLDASDSLLVANSDTVTVLDSSGGYVLKGYAAGDGSFLNSLNLSSGNSLAIPNVALAGDKFYYYLFDSGGSGPIETGMGLALPPIQGPYESGEPQLYVADLSSGSNNLFYEANNAITAIALTGNLIQLVDGNGQLITLDENGQVLAITDVDDSATSVLPTGRGLLIAGYNGLDAFSAGVAPAEGSLTFSTLRQDWLAADGNGTFELDLALVSPPLSDDPEARGQLYLRGTLYSADPAGEPDPTLHHLLAISPLYPFTILDSSSGLVVQSSQPVYRLDRPDIAADDSDALIEIVGEVRNTSPLASDITVSLTRDDGTLLLNQTFTAVGPDETRSFTASDSTAPAGTLIYTATSSLGPTQTLTLQIKPITPIANSSLSQNNIVVGESATIQVNVSNPAGLTAYLTLDLGSGPQDVALLPGASASFSQVVTPTTAGSYDYFVSFGGDVNRTDTLTLNVANETVTATIELDGTIRDDGALHCVQCNAPTSPSLVQGENAGLLFNLESSESFDIFIDYSLSGAADLFGSQQATVYAGVNQVGVTLGVVPAGTYQANLTVRHARLGTIIGTASLDFEVVTPVYELSIDLTGEPMDEFGTALVSFQANSGANSEQPWTGTLLFLDSNLVVDRQIVTLYPGSYYNNYLYLNLFERAGLQQFRAVLVDSNGLTVVEAQLDLPGPQRLAPSVTFSSLSDGAGAAGEQITLLAIFENEGPAGDVALFYEAFDQRYDLVLPVSQGQTSLEIPVEIPAELLNGLYPVEVNYGQQRLRAFVTVTGRELQLSQFLDAAAYDRLSPATWSVVLEGVIGSPAQYDVAMRYLTDEYTETVTIGAGEVVTVAWTFPVGLVSERGTVIVQNHPTQSSPTRHSLLIDTLNIPVIEDPRAWLESDKGCYAAGETVNLTLHLTQPTNMASVFGPPELGSPLLWSSLLISQTFTISNPYTIGDYSFNYPLPAAMATGRYFFQFTFDGEQRFLPIDVHGTTLAVESMAISPSHSPFAPSDTLTITADVRSNVPAGPVVIIAYGLHSDGTTFSLGNGAMITGTLPAGLSHLSLSGVLNSSRPGSARIVLKIYDVASRLLLGSEARAIDVGLAVISSLQTNQGVYSSGQSATATLTLYGHDPATQVRVETSGGLVLLDQTLAPAGFQSLSFPIPTTLEAEFDEVLIATVTDSTGLVSSLQAAYKVADALDISPPEVEILTPAGSSTFQFPTPSHTITLTGIFSEETAIDTVLVAGNPAGLSGNNWQAPVELSLGLNLIEVVAMDAAGNSSQTKLLAVTAEPSYGISLSVVPTATQVNQPVTYTAILTASELLTATALFPFSYQGLQADSGNATAGNLDLAGSQVVWTGVISPAQPVIIQWIGIPTAITTRTIFALLQGIQMLPRQSNEVPTNILPESPTAIALLMVRLRPEGNWGWLVPAGILLLLALFTKRKLINHKN